MRSSIIITKRGAGYISTVSGRFGGGHQGARAGLTPYDAAATAARYMIEYAQSNADGGDLMAPPEVLDYLAAHEVDALLEQAMVELLVAFPGCPHVDIEVVDFRASPLPHQVCELQALHAAD